jgi:endonuclease YncB( thermonuclease family)
LRGRRGPAALLGLLLLALHADGRSETLHSYALINDDATLVVENRRVHLAGIYVPTTRASCIDRPRPGCRTRAAAALAFRIQGFVQCEVTGRRADDSRVAVCHLGRSAFDPGIDLGAYLVERGWALAAEDAPYEYRALQELARAQGAGIWGNARIWTPRGYR